MSYWWDEGTLLETIYIWLADETILHVHKWIQDSYAWWWLRSYQLDTIEQNVMDIKITEYLRIVPWQCSDQVVFINVRKTDTARQAANSLPILFFGVCPSQDDIVNTLSYQVRQNHFVEQSSLKSHHNMVQYDIILQCQKLEKCLQVRHTSYFWASWSFHMFTGPLFQIILHFLSTDLLSGFQSSPGALKSTE